MFEGFSPYSVRKAVEKYEALPEAAIEGNPRHRIVGSREQFPRLFETHGAEVFHRRFPGCPLEKAKEMRGRYGDEGRDILERELRAEAHVHEMDRTVDHPRKGQARFGRCVLKRRARDHVRDPLFEERHLRLRNPVPSLGPFCHVLDEVGYEGLGYREIIAQENGNVV